AVHEKPVGVSDPPERVLKSAGKSMNNWRVIRPGHLPHARRLPRTTGVPFIKERVMGSDSDVGYGSVLGYVESPVAAMAAGSIEPWRVERGYKFVIVMVRSGGPHHEIT